MGEGFSGWYTIAVHKDGTPEDSGIWACPRPGQPFYKRLWTDIYHPPSPGFPSREDADAFNRSVGSCIRQERHVTADELRALVSMWRAQAEAER